MSIGNIIINLIEGHRDRRLKNRQNSFGQFWRDGGNELLYKLPVTTGGLIIDAGGYHGEWTAEMISRYGCRSQVFEPVPEYFEHCREYFKNNSLVELKKAALGGADRATTFNIYDDGTSEHRMGNSARFIEADVIDIAKVLSENNTRIACLKLNIEGGEYEVLERMLETNTIMQCDSLLVQFHRQPDDYVARYENIIESLNKTHTREWCYYMVWEKWDRKSEK